MILDRWGSRDDPLKLTKSVMTRTTGGFNICLNVSREESIHNLKIQLEECGWSDAEKDFHFGDGTLERAVWIGEGVTPKLQQGCGKSHGNLQR